MTVVIVGTLTLFIEIDVVLIDTFTEEFPTVIDAVFDDKSKFVSFTLVNDILDR